MTDLAIAPPDERMYRILAEAGLGPDVFNPRQYRACELVELYALHLAVDLVGRLGLAGLLSRPHTPEALLAAAGFVPAIRPLLHWLLERLSLEALAVHEDGAYRLAAPLPAPALDPIRAAGLAEDPSYAPTYALLDEAAAIAPAVARGKASGERALFQKVTLWVAYFSNANAYYALNNRVAAHAAAPRVSPGAAVLEVGAGLGSATEALLEALAARDALRHLGAYGVTEPVPFFRRRAGRTLEAAWPAAPLAFAALDLNRPWAAQGVEPGGQQLVWGVNVFHLARDLDAVLREARHALAPGGWLVVGEGMRPFPDRPVGAEMPFQLLESFTDVRLDPVRRPTAGFLTAEHWRDTLARAGFAPVELVPDAIRLRAVYPGFMTAAVCGQRP